MLKDTYAAWNADKAPRLAAAIAYSTIFAIAPLFIITIAIVGVVLGFTGSSHAHGDVEDALLRQIGSAAGDDAAQLVRGMVDASFGKPRESVIAQIVGWATFALGASGVFAALQDALNTVWDAKPPEAHQNILVMVRDRALTLSMLLVVGFLVIVTSLSNVAIAYVSEHFAALLPFANAGFTFAAINWLVSLIVVALLFGLIFKVLPDADVRWSDVRFGAIATALLFVIGQALIGLYIGKAGVASAYGASGALLAILVWIYYSALILLLGAEFTKIYSQRRAAPVPTGITPPERAASGAA